MAAQGIQKVYNMKKNLMAMALCLVCALLASCVSKEQKSAVEYLKNSMKSPSSFKVVSVEVEHKEARISYDTLYHVSKWYGFNSYGIRATDSVLVDSIEIWRIEYPMYTDYFIEYDAANSYGAIIRDSESVYYVDEENIFLFKEFISKYADEKVFDHKEAYEKVFTNGVSKYIKEDSWVYSFDLGLY